MLAAIAAGVVSAGCDDDTLEPLTEVASVQIAVPDSLVLGASADAAATVMDQAGRAARNYLLGWSSSDPLVLNVDIDGTVSALRPGAAFIRARVGNIADSIRIRVTTSHCNVIHGFGNVGSNFGGASLVGPGYLTWDWTSLQYMHTDALDSGGVMYGTSADSMVVAWLPGGGRDLSGRLCRVEDEAAFHSISVLQTNSGVPSVTGLHVEQDILAYNTVALDDFVLLAYTFRNDSAAPITSLTVGYAADFDLYSSMNVGNFNPVTKVADVVAPDSVANSMVAGIIAIGDGVTSYRAYTVSAPRPTRQIMHTYMTGGIVGPERTAAADVRQIIGVAPFDLQPGETRTVWFAIVGGENRAAFNLHVEQAKAWVALIR